MKMGTSQKQNISVQHRQWNKLDKPHVLSCEEWRNHRFQQMIKAGAEIRYNKEHQLFRISWVGKEPIIVSQIEIEADYNRCYLRQEISA